MAYVCAGLLASASRNSELPLGNVFKFLVTSNHIPKHGLTVSALVFVWWVFGNRQILQDGGWRNGPRTVVEFVIQHFENLHLLMTTTNRCEYNKSESKLVCARTSVTVAFRVILLSNSTIRFCASCNVDFKLSGTPSTS